MSATDDFRFARVGCQRQRAIAKNRLVHYQEPYTIVSRCRIRPGNDIFLRSSVQYRCRNLDLLREIRAILTHSFLQRINQI